MPLSYKFFLKKKLHELNKIHTEALHYASQHAICSSWKPLEEVAGHRRQLATKLGMPQIVQACYHSHHFWWCCIENHSRTKAEHYKEAGCPGVSPTQ